MLFLRKYFSISRSTEFNEFRAVTELFLSSFTLWVHSICHGQIHSWLSSFLIKYNWNYNIWTGYQRFPLKPLSSSLTPRGPLQWIILMRITNTRRSLAKIKCFIFYGLVIISGLSSSQRKILSLFPYFMVKNNVSQIGFESEISMSPFWSAIRHASVRRRRRLHAVKTFKVGGHHFASLSDKTDQSSGVGDSRKK